jgi:Carboxypeptidase regulatory-like domain/TonB dependent receptor
VALRATLSLACCAWLLLDPANSGGQTVATTGAITGKVTDTTGAVLPGIAVTISSVGLMGTRTATSGADGLYRFPGLPPGDYAVVFAADGFATVRREGVHVSIAFTANVDAELELAPLRDEVIVVRGAAPVDRQSTAIAATLDARQLANLPASRSLFAILAATPSVHVARFEVGGSSGDAGSPYGAFGTVGANRPMVDGIIVAGLFPTGFMLNYGSFEEASVGIAAHSAEWPWPGVQMQIVTKAGGNSYRGTIYADYEHKDWQSFNIDAGQIDRGATGGGLPPRDANRLSRYHDINADVGGFIRRDALWWYLSVRDQDVSVRQVNFPVKPYRTHATNYDAKGTWQVTRNHKLVVFGQAGRTHEPNRLDPFGPVGGTLNSNTAISESSEATLNQRVLGWIGKGEWSAVVTDATVFEVRAGSFGADRSQMPNGTAPRFEDLGTLIVGGGNRTWRGTIRRPQVLGSISHFRPGWFGTHTIKGGGEVVQTVAGEQWTQGYPGDVLHVLRNGRPTEVYLFQTPSASESGLRIYSAYASDTWRLNDRLTFNLGLRFDRSRVFVPAATHPVGRFNPSAQVFAAVHNVIDWNTFAPRIGAIVQLSADGRTLAKVHYGVYWYPPGIELGSTASANSSQWWRRYTWSDRDGSRTWEAGEEGRLLGSRGGVSLESLDPRLELPMLREVAASVERELVENIGLRIGVVWRGERQHYMRQDANRPFDAFTVPVTVRDPGRDGTLGTDDDGRSIQAYDVPLEIAARAPVNIVRNIPDANSRYWSLDAVATRRFAGRWSLVAGFEHTWSRDQAGGYVGQPIRNNTYPSTPNDLINAGPDGRYEFRTWSAKVHGTYEGPWDVMVTPLLRHQSGQPFGRTFATALSYGTVRILAEPIDTRRMDSVTLLDVRVEKAFRLRGGRRVAGFVDVFNLLNANPEQNASWSSGSFLRPLTIVSPRIARVGAKLEW